MTGASKILTVSYGTFSCTLEGFDDPFNTMKAIAEYFRDLAADDRYFGAEPPTPDAAMLHRIAERAGNRRVEARIEDHSVILRTGAAMQAESAPAPTVSRAAPPQPAPQPQHAPLPAAGLLAEESVAAKLQRIRAAVARNAKPAEDATLVDEDDTAPTLLPLLALSAEAEDNDADEITGPQQADWDPADDAAVPRVLADTAEPALQAAETGKDRDDPVAAVPEIRLSDMPDPVAAVPEAGPLGEGAPADDVPDSADDVLMLSSVLSAGQLDELPEALPELTVDDLPESAEAEDSALLASVVYAGPEGQETFDGDDFDGDEEEVAAEADPILIPVRDDSAPANDADPDPAEDWDAASFPTAEKDAYAVFAEMSQTAETDDAWPVDPELPEPADTAAEPASASDKLLRARQRVLVVRAPGSVVVTGREADTARAALPEDESEGEADAIQKAEGRAILEDNAKDAEDVTRLLRQTNTEMDEPENRRRLSTMAHLKAAVAATVADLRSAGGGNRTGEATRLDRYRADLARVVRPRRPDGSTPAERPAPLVLVSEQRIDNPAADGTGNRIVPRRISTSSLAIDDSPDDSDAPIETDNIFAASRNFVEFAEHLGASDMPDLLEAAAAYTACIEGRPHFSRPHLMRHVAAATETSDVNREDSMRSFGTLLRQGKIAKVKRGQFAITDSSYFLAEARRMTR